MLFTCVYRWLYLPNGVLKYHCCCLQEWSTLIVMDPIPREVWTVSPRVQCVDSLFNINVLRMVSMHCPLLQGENIAKIIHHLKVDFATSLNLIAQ